VARNGFDIFSESLSDSTRSIEESVSSDRTPTGARPGWRLSAVARLLREPLPPTKHNQTEEFGDDVETTDVDDVAYLAQSSPSP
jgi:hypothetical protein